MFCIKNDLNVLAKSIALLDETSFCFLSSWNEDKQKHISEEFYLTYNIGSSFYYACADAETAISEKDIDFLYKYRNGKYRIAWVALRRGIEPNARGYSKEYELAKEDILLNKLTEIESIKVNFSLNMDCPTEEDKLRVLRKIIFLQRKELIDIDSTEEKINDHFIEIEGLRYFTIDSRIYTEEELDKYIEFNKECPGVYEYPILWAKGIQEPEGYWFNKDDYRKAYVAAKRIFKNEQSNTNRRP